MTTHPQAPSPTLPTIVCETCGASNPADATFCQNCHGFIAWQQATAGTVDRDEAAARTRGATTPGTTPRAAATAEELIETRVLPKLDTTRDTAAAPAPAAPAPAEVRVLRVEGPGEPVVLALDGASVELELGVHNLSDIVDGYEIEPSGAPSWLVVEAEPLRLLPDTAEPMRVRLRIAAQRPPRAGTGTVHLRVRSLTQVPAAATAEVAITVPVLDAPVTLRAEPSLVRIRDIDVARFVLVLANPANRPAEVRLSGTDPELAVAFHFDPAVVTVPAGEEVRVGVAATSARPEPGSERTRPLTLSAADGDRRVDIPVSLVQASSAVVEDPMVALSAAPSLLRLRDTDTDTFRITVDNRGGSRWATVRLRAFDPERVVDVRFHSDEVRVPPGERIDVGTRVTAPPPAPGSHVTRAITVVASDGRRESSTELSVVQSTSPSPMTTLALELDPSVVRLGGSRRGQTSVLVDNRSGHRPVRVRLGGDDPENAVGFTFTPPELEVPAGQRRASRVALRAPRAPSGREISRSLTVSATDGRDSVSATGSLLQAAGDRRPWARVVLTLLGAFAVLVGVVLPFVSGRRSFSALELTGPRIEGVVLDRLGLSGVALGLPGFVSVGLVLVVLAGLMVFGLTGASGRLSRWAALLAAAFLVAAAITFASVGLGTGVFAIGVGFVLGYIGGLLARR